MWMKEKGFEDVVKEAWEYNVDEHLSVKEKLKRGYNIKVIIDMISPKVPDQMKHFLVKPYNRDEVEIALKQMPPSKAPGIDGMPAVFFQKYWLGDEVTNVCLKILNGQESVRSLNKTLIALIPKVEKLEFVTQYRPISLCNEIYIIISKTIANKIKCVLSMVISESQSAFVPKR
ncbi:unnamed protein product [Prunus armeniaca]